MDCDKTHIYKYIYIYAFTFYHMEREEHVWICVKRRETSDQKLIYFTFLGYYYIRDLTKDKVHILFYFHFKEKQ